MRRVCGQEGSNKVANLRSSKLDFVLPLRELRLKKGKVMLIRP